TTAEDSAEKRADGGPAAAEFGGALVGADSALVVEVYVETVDAIFFPVDRDGKKIEDEVGAVHGASAADVSDDELGGSAGGNCDVVHRVENVLADSGAVKLAGAGVVGVDRIVGSNGDFSADGNDFRGASGSGRRRR